jgi:hypothetical protein
MPFFSDMVGEYLKLRPARAQPDRLLPPLPRSDPVGCWSELLPDALKFQVPPTWLDSLLVLFNSVHMGIDGSLRPFSRARHNRLPPARLLLLVKNRVTAVIGKAVKHDKKRQALWEQRNEFMLALRTSTQMFSHRIKVTTAASLPQGAEALLEPLAHLEQSIESVLELGPLEWRWDEESLRRERRHFQDEARRLCPQLLPMAEGIILHLDGGRPPDDIFFSTAQPLNAATIRCIEKERGEPGMFERAGFAGGLPLIEILPHRHASVLTDRMNQSLRNMGLTLKDVNYSVGDPGFRDLFDFLTWFPLMLFICGGGYADFLDRTVRRKRCGFLIIL